MSEKHIDGLSHLGSKTVYKDDYAPEVLEAFDNKVALINIIATAFLGITDGINLVKD